MSNYQDQQIVIIGLGATGLSCVDFLLQQGAMPRVMDTRAHPPGLTQLPQGVTVHLGSLRVDWLLEADLIVLSPGVFSKLPELQQAMTAGVEIIGDIELFCRHVSAPVVAITGSNGKSTVTMLLGQMVQAAGIKVAVGGNLGPPALTLLHPSIELYILELSSFQLESTFSLRATVATILNLTPDHHDRYPEGIAIYAAAKQRIYQQAQCILFNVDDPATQPLHVPQQTACISFGLADADYALIEHQQALWLAAHGEPVLAADALKLLGCHNQMNALAALALADVLAIPRSASLTGLHKFTGLAHRLQRIWQHRGIDWINDSKATNVGSTVAALSGLNIKGHLHLLLGGEGKGADFSPLKAYLQGNHLSLYCFGQVGSQLAALRPEIAECSTTLAQAMQIIAARVKPGDTVLLSPACASFDQFNSFEQRGALFIQLAKALG